MRLDTRVNARPAALISGDDESRVPGVVYRVRRSTTTSGYRLTIGLRIRTNESAEKIIYNRTLRKAETDGWESTLGLLHLSSTEDNDYRRFSRMTLPLMMIAARLCARISATRGRIPPLLPVDGGFIGRRTNERGAENRKVARAAKDKECRKVRETCSHCQRRTRCARGMLRNSLE